MWFPCSYQVQRKGETSSSIFSFSLLQWREDKGSSRAWSLEPYGTGFESQLYIYWPIRKWSSISRLQLLHLQNVSNNTMPPRTVEGVVSHVWKCLPRCLPPVRVWTMVPLVRITSTVIITCTRFSQVTQLFLRSFSKYFFLGFYGKLCLMWNHVVGLSEYLLTQTLSYSVWQWVAAKQSKVSSAPLGADREGRQGAGGSSLLVPPRKPLLKYNIHEKECTDH